MPLLVTQLALRYDFKKQFKAKTLMNGVYHKPVHKLLFSYHVCGKNDLVIYARSTQLRFKIWWKKSRNFIKSLHLFQNLCLPQVRPKDLTVPQISSPLFLQARPRQDPVPRTLPLNTLTMLSLWRIHTTLSNPYKFTFPHSKPFTNTPDLHQTAQLELLPKCRSWWLS